MTPIPHRSRTVLVDLICLALLLAVVCTTGNLILKAALNTGEDLARAATLKGM